MCVESKQYCATILRMLELSLLIIGGAPSDGAAFRGSEAEEKSPAPGDIRCVAGFRAVSKLALEIAARVGRLGGPRARVTKVLSMVACHQLSYSKQAP